MNRIKNICSVAVRPTASENAAFELLDMVKGSATMTISSKKTTQGRMFETALKLKVVSKATSVFMPLIVRVILMDRTYEFGTAFLPVFFETSEDDLLSLTAKYESYRSPSVL